MKKINLDALIAFTEDPESLDGRALAGLERSGLIEKKDGVEDWTGAKLTKGAKLFLKAANELGWCSWGD